MHSVEVKQRFRSHGATLGLLVSVGLAATLSTGCGGPRSKIPSYAQQVPAQHRGHPQRVEKLIISACQARGWTAKPVAKGEILAVYATGQRWLEVTIRWDALNHWLTYSRSAGLGYQAHRNALHPRGVLWMRNLERTIQKTLAAQ